MSRQDDELQVFVGSKCFCNDTFVWNKQPCYLEQNPTKVTAVVLNWFALVYALIPFVVGSQVGCLRVLWSVQYLVWI